MKIIPCPQCGAPMTYIGKAIFECENDSCSIIRATRDSYDGELRHIKKSAVVDAHDKMVGICGICGHRHVRPSPANLAVCAPNGIHDKAVEVPLHASLPTLRFEMREKVVNR